MLKKNMAFERAFVRAGGLLVAGADPTGWGCCLAGFADQRNVELLAEAGFSPEEAIRIASANGAALLGELDQIGTIAVGKRADLVLIRGNPVARIEDIRNVELVFKAGVGFDSAKLIKSLRGKVGTPPPGLTTLISQTFGLDARTSRVVVFVVAALLVVFVATTVQNWMIRSAKARRRTRQSAGPPPES